MNDYNYILLFYDFIGREKWEINPQRRVWIDFCEH